MNVRFIKIVAFLMLFSLCNFGQDKTTNMSETNLRYKKVEKLPIMYDKHNGLEPLINIYPNPVKDILTVEYALLSNASINALGIYDTKGTLLISVPISEQLGIEKINVSGLAKGNYIISFGAKGVNKFSEKFIKN